VDAAFRAEQLKVAVPGWLRQDQKDGLHEEEHLTSRRKGRCHVKERRIHVKKQADLGQKHLLTRDVASHETSADSGQSRHFPANSSTSSFSKKPF
jgi:hypothetical protein